MYIKLNVDINFVSVGSIENWKLQWFVREWMYLKQEYFISNWLKHDGFKNGAKSILNFESIDLICLKDFL